MAATEPAANEFTSTQLAADQALVPIWDPAVPFPSYQEMKDLDVVTHVVVEKAKPDGYHYLHEATITRHRDRFYMGWANHRTRESGDYDELIRGCSSPDAIHWNEPEIWGKAPLIGATSLNHPLLFDHQDRLYGFFVCWREGHRPTTEIFILNDTTGQWDYQEGAGIPNFVPFCSPQRMVDGNWVIGGEHYWFDAAVAISDGDDFTRWTMVDIPRPEALKILYPESAIVHDGGSRLTAVCRPYSGTNGLMALENYHMYTAPASESFDCGKTWTPLRLSNFPLADSQPFAGRLSTGQNYLLTNSLEEKRGLLSIAVTGPEGGLFREIFKVRHQHYPIRRLFANAKGEATEWSYPNAFEYDGKLYVACSEGKEDCVLSIIPIEALAI